MISDEKECIFVHVPKTGGTSIENVIWGRDASTRREEDLWMGSVRPGFNKYQSGGLQHLLARQIRIEVGATRFDSYYKFAFVRNPWDKTVSQYHYLKTRPMLRKYMGLNRFSSFAAYVKAIATKSELHVQSFEQWHFLVDEAGNTMVDFVGRFENLQRDFDVVGKELGLTDVQLPHDMKSTKRKPYQAYYTPSTRALVAQTYARDVERFGYRF